MKSVSVIFHCDGKKKYKMLSITFPSIRENIFSDNFQSVWETVKITLIVEVRYMFAKWSVEVSFMSVVYAHIHSSAFLNSPVFRVLKWSRSAWNRASWLCWICFAEINLLLSEVKFSKDDLTSFHESEQQKITTCVSNTFTDMTTILFLP